MLSGWNTMNCIPEPKCIQVTCCWLFAFLHSLAKKEISEQPLLQKRNVLMWHAVCFVRSAVQTLSPVMGFCHIYGNVKTNNNDKKKTNVLDKHRAPRRPSCLSLKGNQQAMKCNHYDMSGHTDRNASAAIPRGRLHLEKWKEWKTGIAERANPWTLNFNCSALWTNKTHSWAEATKGKSIVAFLGSIHKMEECLKRHAVDF